MRTTLTLDEDVAAAAVNELLRTGLYSRAQAAQEAKFQVQPRKLGHFHGLNYDNINGLLDELEGPAHS